MSTYHDDPAIDAAIRATFHTHPYYRPAIDRLRIVADPNVPTMATSRDWITHYNPATVAGWTTDEAAAVLVHELEHLLRRHSERCGERDPQRWNVAADAEINERLPGLPDGAVYPETIGMPRGQVAEVYYSATEPQPKPEPEQGDGQGDGDGAEGQGSGKGSGKPQPGQCGSAAGGPTQPHEVGDSLRPGPGAADGGKQARREVAEQVIGAYGTDPGDELREWAEREVGIDRAAWYSALAATVGHVMSPHGAPTRYQWPGRRAMADMGGAMVPHWTGTRPSCAVVIDNSGSITPMDRDMAAAAGHYIARMADVKFYACDIRAYSLGSSLPDALPGGGGTDMGAGIAMAIAEGAKAVVVITDCQTPWPTEQTIVPVIVGANPGARDILNGKMERQYPLSDWSRRPPEWMTVLPVQQDPEQ